MNGCRSAICTFGIGLFIIAAIPTHALSMGFSGVGSAPCDNATQNIVGRFSSNSAQYSSTGLCTTPGSLGAPRTFPYTVKGAYSGNIAEEVIEVAPAPLSQPSHPSGKWHTKYSCPSDPWLTLDGPPFNSSSLRVKCQIIARVDNSPSESYPKKYDKNGKPLPSIQELFDKWRADKPMTSWVLMPATRQALAAKRDQDLKAEALAKVEAEKRRVAKRLKSGLQQQSPFRTSQTPIVRSPVGGQRFLNQTAVPINLAPPPQWGETNIDINTGQPIKTAKSVTGYMVRIERKDSTGNWVAQTTLPVGASEAESAAGYTGFGAGTPPCCLTVPGAYRISAQVSSPKPSGWSDWVEFGVMEPPTSKNKMLKPPTRSFGK